MEKLGKWILTSVLILIVCFLLAQVIGLLGKQNLGWSLKYITTYIILLGVALLFLAVFGILIEALGRDSDMPLLDMFSVFDFDESQDFRLFNGDPRGIAIGLVVGFAFLCFITATVIGFNAQWQPLPGPIESGGIALSPMAEGHDDDLAQLDISRETEAWFISAQPSVSEDINFNYFIPTILTALLLLVPLLLGMELNKGTFVLFSTFACLITSGLFGAWQSGLIPTFAGSHSDVYVVPANFYMASGFSFMASWINMQVGYPVSILAHFSNNWIITLAIYTTLSVGMAVVKSNLLFTMSKKLKRGSKWT